MRIILAKHLPPPAGCQSTPCPQPGPRLDPACVAELAQHAILRCIAGRTNVIEMRRVYLTTADKTKRLSDPKVRAHLLKQVRWTFRTFPEELGVSPSQLKELDAQLQCPPMLLYETGLFEIVAPAIGSSNSPRLEWPDLSVDIVFEQGSADLNAGDVVWSALGA